MILHEYMNAYIYIYIASYINFLVLVLDGVTYSNTGFLNIAQQSHDLLPCMQGLNVSHPVSVNFH